MSRTVLNFLLDLMLLLAFLGLVCCAAILRFVFPPGPEARGWRLWGLTYDHWTSLQMGMVGLLALGVLVHVMLHWNWVCGVVASRVRGKGRVDEGTQTLYGVGVLIFLLHIVGLVLAAAVLTVQPPS
jgi:hypothetical protein